VKKRKPTSKILRKSKNKVGLALRLRRTVSRARGALGGTLYVVAIIILAVATLLASAAFVVSVVRSPYFQVRDVEVRGTTRVTSAQVMKLIGWPKPQSIFEIPMRRIEAALERNPWVERALARRKFPDRLIVDITERKPRAVVHLEDLFYVDQEGVVFKRVTKGDGLNFPILTGLKEDEVAGPEGRELLARALELQNLLEKEARFRSIVSEIHVSKRLGFSVITTGKTREIRFGFDNFPLKMESLKKLFDQLEGQRLQARFIDLSFRNLVLVRPAGNLEDEDTVGL
jgi:cell division protein FtsQ